MESTQLNESFPKRIRSVSARLFSINNETTVHAKRSSCHIMASSPEHHSILNPSKWFPRMRCRSSSSASSTFSLVFSSSVNSSFTEPFQFSETYHLENHVTLESVSSELEELYKVAKEEIAYAIESQDSIYYEGDKQTAETALELCQKKYDSVMTLFKETANAIKFKFRWESDLLQLRNTFDSLPKISYSIYD